MIMYRLLALVSVAPPEPSSDSGQTLFLKLILSVRLPEQPLKLSNPRLVAAPVAIASERHFWILSQLFPPPARKTRMNTMLSRYLNQWFPDSSSATADILKSRS
jgi:hypothetical protein